VSENQCLAFSGCHPLSPGHKTQAVLLLAALVAVPVPVLPASISGTVVEWATGRPLAPTVVSLQVIHGQAVVDRGQVLADRHGQFQFNTLPDGAYLVRASRLGYATGVYGQQSWNGTGSPASVEGDGDFSAALRLRRLAALSGRVEDENQVGLPVSRSCCTTKALCCSQLHRSAATIEECSTPLAWNRGRTLSARFRTGWLTGPSSCRPSTGSRYRWRGPSQCN